ncbi:hypothetical protein I3760_01G014000 [Carya illinoinensis]|uniref:Filament-like plant protein 7 n=2 Tax=Carya illinoinensis TaxID=32201 RepID=A0A922FVB8_CARIL|nr:hypothetical protein I3760_01G014000 [Carya illinoinensis]KAG2724374.1 hypothetical protein I3760_01G014000 [Carya illinoinensis]KAG2724375.1 hypothetical protein I3760_01G014000 [Carya illinoinensis]KAG2724376.1 hypothetical protein I3760_01G014000 [Carya illinoinensis]KAG6729180.1 hypothetical protein I3842_01G014000 [Carya illinoinensis]
MGSIMDHKTWLWRKKSSEKTIISADTIHNSSKGNEEEIQTLLTEKAELEKDLKILNDKLSSALSECEAKDELEKKHAKTAQEAISDWEKAEAEVASLKRELDEALQQRVAGEERSVQLDVALRECMQQLRFVREEQEKRIHDAVMKTSKEFEKSQMVLEEKLAETSKRLAKIGIENSHLTNALLAKEKSIEDVNKQLTQKEVDFSALMTRLQSMEKDNASLKYEVRVLEKELEIRNEEREFNRRTADASHKQHLESVKKIAKLESECQRLRLLVRKRLPGPAALAKMKNEVEMLGRDSVDMRRRKLNTTAFMVDSVVDDSPENPTKRIGILADQLCAMEEENKNLKETLHKKANELQFSRVMYARSASQLSQVESQLEEVSKGQSIVEPTRIALMSHDLSLASMSDIGSDDKVSCAESWASALITELEHFRNGKQKGSPSSKTIGTSDINLMDDFVEMERLALVSVDKPFGSSQASSLEANAISRPLDESSSELAGMQIVPLSDSESGFNVSNQEIRSKDTSISKVPGWLQDILKVLLEQNRITQRNPDELLEDIREALPCIYSPNSISVVDAGERSNNPDAFNAPVLSGYISEKASNKSSAMVLSDVDVSLTEKSNPQLQLDLRKSIGKIIELIEGISLSSLDYDNPDTLARKDGNTFTCKNSETASGYMVRVFQWKISELGAVLQQFVRICDDLLSGRANIDKFAQELTISLEWIMNHCFSLQDVSNMREAIMKHFDCDESRSESEAEVGTIGHFSEAGRVPREYLSYLPLTAASNGNRLMNLKSAKKDLEGRPQSATDTSESLMSQLHESEKTIASLQTELETLKKSTQRIENQIKSHKLTNEDLDRQLTVARVELNEAQQKFSSLEVELDDKRNCCEELEATCLELQLQLESVTKKESPSSDPNQEEKQLRTDWEITAASEKLAECQETILNLGKQLKALAAPKEAALFDKVIASPMPTTPTTATTPAPPKDKIMNQRTSLLDKMLAEDDAVAKNLQSPKTKEIDGNFTRKINGPFQPPENIVVLNGVRYEDDNTSARSLAIVASKKRGGGSLWRKLLWRKKGTSKKAPLLFVP